MFLEYRRDKLNWLGLGVSIHIYRVIGSKVVCNTVGVLDEARGMYCVQIP